MAKKSSSISSTYKVYGIGIALFWGISLKAVISTHVPVDAPTYDDIDILEAYQCAQATYRGLRPQSHDDLRSALALFENQKEKCEAPEWLLAEREILISPLLPAQFSVGVGLRNEESISLPGLDAEVTPNFPMRHGRPDFFGPNLWGEASVSGAVGQNFGLALSATPGGVVALEDSATFQGKAYLQEWNVKLGVGRWEVSAGRTALQVGGPKHGALLLSQGTKPLKLWKMALRPSFPLDGSSAFLGPFALETWFADAGDSAIGISGSKFWAIGLGARPFSFFEFSLLQLYQWGGVGAPTLNAKEILSMLYYSSDPELETKRQRQLLLDVAFWAPRHWVKGYGQILFGPLRFSEETGYLAGLWFPRLGGWEARIEYVTLGRLAYTHPVWTQGMSYEMTPLGHPIGPGGQAIYVDLGFPVWDGTRTALGAFYEARGEHRIEPAEFRVGGTVGLAKRWERLSLLFSGRYASIQNLFYQNGEKKQAFSFWATMIYSAF